jgi:pyrroline-5-carboxylate reductase
MMSNKLLSFTARHLSLRLCKPTTAAAFSTTPSNLNIFDKVTFLGTGKMAQAMMSPLMEKNLQTPQSITAYDVSDTALDHVQKLFPGIDTATSIAEAITDSQLIVYAVKPQNVDKVHSQIRRAKFEVGGIRDDATILSVAAGKPIDSFFASGIDRVARSMPNTPAQIGAGVTVWGCTDNINSEDRARIKKVLDSFGKTVFVDDEMFIDMSTSISGSGPAYIFLLMEAMIDAGVHMGFSRETATTLVHHTLLGSTKFAMETGEHPAVLRNSVTSPAGTTASAIYELENGKFRTVIKDAIWACYRRSLEMGGMNSQVGPGRQQVVVMGTEEMLENHDSSPAPLNNMINSKHHPVEPPKSEMKRTFDEHDENGNGRKVA